MPIRRYKPTSAGRRLHVRLDVRGDHEDDAGEEPARSAHEEGRPQRKRPDHDAPPGRRTQAPLPPHRLQAREGTACPQPVAAIEYDPNRSARIALLHYADGAKAYILAPLQLKVGATVESGPEADIKVGNALPL